MQIPRLLDRLALHLLATLPMAAAPLLAQGGSWTRQVPMPTSGNVWSLAAISATEVWGSASPSLGDFGGVVHTSDAGDEWTLDSLGSGQVNAVAFVDAQHGWAAGNGFRYTLDGGASWVQVNNWGTIYDLQFLDTQRGWACGNGSVAYRTVDGGQSWSGVMTPGGATMSSIWFQDALTGWAVSISGRIVRSTDGGQSWSLVHDAGAYLSTIQFLSPLEGWAIGGDTFLHTIDGGLSWAASAVPGGTWSHGARFASPSVGVAVGEAGNIVRTTDGGSSWSTIAPAGSGPRLWDVEFADAQHGYYSGDSGAIYRTTDGGASWAQIQNGAFGITRGMDALDSRRAWAANQGGEIQRTSDGGVHWQRVSVAGFDLYGDLHDIDFVDANRGWVVGENDFFGGSEGRIARSLDGGASWSLQFSLPATELLGVTAIDDQHVLVYGRGNFSQSAYLQTFDGGQTWVGGGPAATGGFRDAFFLNDGLTGWIVGDDIHHTSDGGQTWSLQFQGPGPQFSSVSFADANHGWAVGFQGLVARTTDGGLNWSLQSAGAPAGAAILGVTAVAPDVAWVAGWSGFVARTGDGGASWQPHSLPGADGADFECAEFAQDGAGWVAGDLGIWRWSDAGDCQDASSFCASLANSTGAGAAIRFLGSCEVAAGDLVLEASPVPDQPFLFFFGTEPVMLAFGNGLRCVGGTTTRLGPVAIAGGHLASRLVRPADFGLFPGSSAYFQCWFRDPAAGGAAFNLSDGLHITFE